MIRAAAFLLLGSSLAAHGAAEPLSSCRQAVIDYAYHWDHGNVDGFARLFTGDATLTLGGDTFSGRDAIAERMRAAQPGPVYRHLMTTVKLSAVEPGMAKGVSYVTLYVAEPVEEGLPQVDGFALLGEYHDTFELDGQDCRIAERRLVPVMQQRRTSG